MKSFVVKLADFFKLNRSGATSNDNFDAGKRHFLIPMYQREYKWDKPKIQCLIRDVAIHEKFLGIIILDENDTAYEIVDGQQRITTCFLMLMAMYNLHNGQQREQQHILSLMQPYNAQFVLGNDSVGDYICVANSQMSLCIDDSRDMYFQKVKFQEAYATVLSELTVMKSSNSLRDFQQKLRDCEVLVMVNETNTGTQPIEQVFLDINEKSQLLDYEDIFKGHCFENFTDDSLHPELRRLWAQLKYVGVRFGTFGYENLSQYLYHYILVNVDKSIPENLCPDGIHVLTGKTMDETELMLKRMIEYGEKVLCFRIAVGQDTYRFVDICADSQSHSNTSDHIALKRMSIEILDTNKSLYQKLPFFVLIHALYTMNFGGNMTHDTFRKIITNIYIYSSLFVFRGGKKSKGDIDLTIKDALSDVAPVQVIVTAAKQMRKALVDQFEFKANFKSEALEFVYSIIDFYNANQNWLGSKYTKESGVTLEHFIIPDNRTRRVTWSSQTNFDFAVSNTHAADYKKRAYNFIFLPKTLNEQLEHDDVISKISGIRDWYSARNEEIPVHIGIFLDHIEALPTYQEIQRYKETPTTPREDIEAGYNNFIEEFFSVEKQLTLGTKLQRAFQESFLNT